MEPVTISVLLMILANLCAGSGCVWSIKQESGQIPNQKTKAIIWEVRKTQNVSPMRVINFACRPVYKENDKILCWVKPIKVEEGR